MDLWIFNILAPFSLFLQLVLLFRLWHLRNEPSFRYLLAAILCASGWLTFNFLSILANTELWTHFWMHLFQPFVGFLPVFIFLFISEYSFQNKLSKLGRAGLFILPSITAVLVITNSMHQWVWQSVEFVEIGEFLSTKVSYGWWFHVHTAYSYALVLLTLYRMVSYIRSSEQVRRREAVYLLASIAVPVLTNAIHMLGLFPGWHKDFSSITFGISVILLNQVMYEYYTTELRRKVRSAMSGV